ncbi:hypothetical protein E2C01_007706 [Portunus trituberculatus]|uniref:Uncharacterized protein n=1 Tax=Portunus trituberculatus TaxID=210409 RepID=A0A5B7CYU0_PORTR|nr:hypothetical protein [Portunus trituberculatus]
MDTSGSTAEAVAEGGRKRKSVVRGPLLASAVPSPLNPRRVTHSDSQTCRHHHHHHHHHQQAFPEPLPTDEVVQGFPG